LSSLNDDENKFLDKMYRRSKSLHSRRFYRAGLRKFNLFKEEENIRITQKNIYSILDRFMEWLYKKEIRPKTQVNYLVAARRYLRYSGLKIDENEFRDKVTIPRVTKIPDQPITIEDLRTLLTAGRPNPKMRALILTLVSSGMRLGEALGVNVKHLDLDAEPGRITIPAELTKARARRVAYVSREAKSALAQIVKGVSKENLVFGYSGDAWQREKVAIRTFRAVVERSSLDEKLENHRTHRIHFHAFRKFYFTKVADTLGEHIAHALTGHGFYMDTYYRKSEAERAKDYLKVVGKLTVLADVEKDDTRSEFAQILMELAGFEREELNKMDLSSLTTEQIRDAVRTKLGSGNNIASAERVIGQDQLSQYLKEGYSTVVALQNGDVVVRSPKAVDGPYI